MYTHPHVLNHVPYHFIFLNQVDVVYKLSHDHLELAVKNGAKLLCGQLHAGVDPEGSTWTMDQTSRRCVVRKL